MLTELIFLWRQTTLNQTNTLIQIELRPLLVTLQRKHITKKIDVAGKIRNGKMRKVEVFKAQKTSHIKMFKREAAHDFPGTERRPE